MNARYACDMQKLRFRFFLSGHLVGDFDSPIPRFEKNGVFLCGSYWRSRSGYSLSLFGESCPDDDSRQSQNPEKLQNVRRKQNHGKAKER